MSGRDETDRVIGGVRCTRRVAAAVLTAAALALAGCKPAATVQDVPPPVELTGDVAFEATGYYCGMLLADHGGPKGQIHLGGRAQPLWFSSVRDTIAFMRLPEEPRDMRAIYVNDMGRARDWERPEAGTWTDARTAWYVIDSTMRGGMGAPEAIPFKDEAAAQAFRGRHSGRVLRLEQIPDAYVLGPVELSPPSTAAHGEAAAAASSLGGATVAAAGARTAPSAPSHPGH